MADRTIGAFSSSASCWRMRSSSWRSRWRASSSRVLGACIGAPGRGQQPLLLLFNAEPADTPFVLPPGAWQPLLDTADDAVGNAGTPQASGSLLLRARSVALLAGPAFPSPPARPGA